MILKSFQINMNSESPTERVRVGRQKTEVDGNLCEVVEDRVLAESSRKCKT